MADRDSLDPSLRKKVDWLRSYAPKYGKGQLTFDQADDYRAALQELFTKDADEARRILLEVDVTSEAQDD